VAPRDCKPRGVALGVVVVDETEVEFVSGPSFNVSSGT